MDKKAFQLTEVKEFVESNSSCKMVSSEYKNADSIISLQCKCNKIFSVKFRQFKYRNVRMCEDCRKAEKSEKGKINSLSSASTFISKLSNGECELVSEEYIDNKSPLNIKCRCGNIFSCSITNLKQRKVVRCKECKLESQRMTSQELEEIAEQGGCKILSSDNYKNEESILCFACKCGNEFYCSLKSFKANAKMCDDCYRAKMSENQRNDFNEVIKEVSKTNCELLSTKEDYINQYSNLTFRCSCGNSFKRSFANFKRRESFCPECTSSKGEKAVAATLRELGVNFEMEYTFEGLNSSKNKPLRYDFAIFMENKVSCLIEYDGEFHFSPIISDEDFYRLTIHDNKKNAFCKKNNLPLLRIPYQEYENIDCIVQKFLLQVNTEVKHDLKAMAHRRA